MLADANFQRSLMQRANRSPIARRRFDAHAERAGIRTIADKMKFQLSVRIAAIVAPKLQTNLRAKNQIRVAVLIEIRRND